MKKFLIGGIAFLSTFNSISSVEVLSQNLSSEEPTTTKVQSVKPPGIVKMKPMTFSDLSESTGSVDCAKEKCVAITFDDGPSAHTERLLDILSKQDSKATFFVLGSLVESHSGTVLRVLAEGSEIGNHTWDHSQLTKISDKKVINQITKTDDILEKITGKRSIIFRPPYGAYNKNTLKLVNKPTILWNVDTVDWKERDAKKLQKRLCAVDKADSIILMHDIHKSTIDGVEEGIKCLKEKGFKLVTISQLYNNNLANQSAYTNKK